MKASVSANMATHLAGDVSTMAYLWKVIRSDGTIFGFTSHDEPIVYGGLTYEASSGFTPGLVATTSGLAVDDVELEGVLDSESITQADLVAGRWDGAEVILYRVNWKALADGAIILRRGWTGEVRSGRVAFFAELRGLAQRLQQQIGQNFSPLCRASFCDARCGLTHDDYEVTGTITAVTSRMQFTDSTRAEAADYFNGGIITFTSGANDDLSREVKTFGTSVIGCSLPFPFDVEIGDAYSLWRGCSKTLAACIAYSNVINFRGEPHMPPSDVLMRGP